MSCTTILVGRDASYDGSTIIARNEDSCFGEFDPKRFVVVKPADQPRAYTTVQSHLTVALPDDPLQYTAVPNADLHIGEWGEAGVNEANVAMSATETITTNERVLGADPLVEYVPARCSRNTVHTSRTASRSVTRTRSGGSNRSAATTGSPSACPTTVM